MDALSFTKSPAFVFLCSDDAGWKARARKFLGQAVTEPLAQRPARVQPRMHAAGGCTEQGVPFSPCNRASTPKGARVNHSPQLPTDSPLRWMVGTPKDAQQPPATPNSPNTPQSPPAAVNNRQKPPAIPNNHPTTPIHPQPYGILINPTVPQICPPPLLACLPFFRHPNLVSW